MSGMIRRRSIIEATEQPRRRCHDRCGRLRGEGEHAGDGVDDDLKLEGSSGKALRQAIAATRRGGMVSVPGVYAGFIHGFLFGDAFDKGLTFKMGQTHVQQLSCRSCSNTSSEGELNPEVIITHHLPLAEAARGYEIFNDKEEDCRKVVLTPDGPGKNE